MFLVGLTVLLIVGPSTGDWGLAAGLGVGLWVSGGLSSLVNSLTAAMRGGDPYLDAEHELSAYAQTDLWGFGGESWLEWQDRMRKR